VLATGAILHSAAKRGFADYDEAIRVCALTDPTGGCSMPGSAIFDRKSSAETKQNLAYAGYALGGAALVAGAALVVLNRPSSYRIEVPEAPGAGAGAVAGWSVVPVFSSEGGGVAAGGRSDARRARHPRRRRPGVGGLLRQQHARVQLRRGVPRGVLVHRRRHRLHRQQAAATARSTTARSAMTAT
jgi:hypothetical protein